MTIERISTNFAGDESQGSASGSGVSSTGRYVVYVSDAKDIVGGPADSGAGVYVRDMETGSVERIDRAVGGGAVNGSAVNAQISGDGRYVVYTSTASNLTADGVDDNSRGDVFVFDRITKTTKLVSASADGSSGSGWSDDAVISSNGRYVAFRSQANDLPTGGEDRIDYNTQPGSNDLFVMDLQTGYMTIWHGVGPNTEGDSIWNSNVFAVSDDGIAAFHHVYRDFDADGSYADFGFMDDGTSGSVAGYYDAYYAHGGRKEDPDRVAPPNEYHLQYSGGEYRGRSEFFLYGYSKFGGSDPANYTHLYDNRPGYNLTTTHDVVLAANGRFAVYASNFDVVSQTETDGVSLYLLDLDTGTVTVLVLAAAGDPFQNIQISANGQWITFTSNVALTSDDTNGTSDIYRIENPFGSIGGGSEGSFPGGTVGTPEADVLVGTGGDDRIDALASADIVYGSFGNDTIFGGDGTDQIYGNAGTDIIDGGAGDDIIAGDNGASQPQGGEASDRLYGRAGEDDMYGEFGDDFLYGGTDNDNLYGDSGRDVLHGEGGDDFLDGGSGDDEFVGGAGNDEIRGGTDVDNSDRDIVIYEGSSSDYVIHDRLEQGVGVYTDVTDEYGDTDTISEVERAQFEEMGYNTPTVTSGLLTIAQAALAAYDEDATLEASGWHALSALELGMATSGDRTTPGGVEYGFNYRNGVYEAFSDAPGPGDTLINANAHVYFGVVEGRNTLMLAFRGTDEGVDVLDYPKFELHYAKFEPLIRAVLDYIDNNAYTTSGQTIDQVWVAGHSLGGAMAQMFMQDARVAGNAGYTAATFGSPGSERYAADDRILHFEHSVDLVPYAGDIARLAAGGIDLALEFSDVLKAFRDNPTDFRTAGGVIRMSSQAGDNPGAQHSMSNYVQSAANLVRYEGVLSTFVDDGIQSGERLNVVAGSAAGEVLTGANILLPKLLRGLDYFDGSEVFLGGGGADVMQGGAGTDIFAGFFADLQAATLTIVDMAGGERLRVFNPEFTEDQIGYIGDPANPYSGLDLLLGNDTIVKIKGWHSGEFRTEVGDGFIDIIYEGALGFIGSGDDEELGGGTGDDSLDGGGGNDLVEGGEGSDHLFGGEGSDEILGGARNDHLSGDGSLTTNESAARSLAPQTAGGNDRLDGGAGWDTLTGGGGRDTFVLGTGGSAAGLDTITDFQAGAGGDVLDLTGFLNHFPALDAQANAFAGGYITFKFDGAGSTLHLDYDGYLGRNPSFVQGSLNNLDPQQLIADNVVIDNGSGEDAAVHYVQRTSPIQFGSPDGQVLAGTIGNDTIDALAGDDTVSGGDGNDELTGRAGHDTLYGETGEDLLRGGDGDDILHGGAGRDDLRGGSGSDTLAGGLEADLIWAGAGNDQIDGGEGTDRASFTGARSDYRVEMLAGGKLRITDLRTGADGTDEITNIETFGFADRDYRLAELLGDTPVNRAPSSLAIDYSAVVENASAGAVVGTVTGSDPDGDTLVYSLVDDAGGRFAIDAATGSVTTMQSFDHEATPSFEIVVRATDAEGLFLDKTLTISINDANEAPTGLGLDPGQVPENRPAGTQVGTAAAADPDGDVLTYSLVDDAGGRFAIDSVTGALVTTQDLDHEAGASYDVVLRATDSRGLHVDRSFTIAVEDVNEAPLDVMLDDASIAENAAAGTVVGTASSSDPDGDAVTYTLADDAQGRFAIDATTGVLTATRSFDHEATPSFRIVVRASDAAGAYVERAVIVLVEDLNDNAAPVAGNDGPVAVSEDATSSNLWSLLLGNDTDVDPGDVLAITSVDTSATKGSIVFDAATQTLRYVADADVFDLLATGAKTTDTFTYTITDKNRATSTATVTLDVTGVADGRTIKGGNGKDTLTGTEGEDVITGLNGNDTLSGLGGADRLDGGNGNDILNGGNGIDTLIGGNGDDKLDGGNGSDSLNGGHGQDQIFGGAGDDTIIGSNGHDLLTGGAGADAFVFGISSDIDKILDFNVEEDRLEFTNGATVEFHEILDNNNDGTLDTVLVHSLGGVVILLGVEYPVSPPLSAFNSPVIESDRSVELLGPLWWKFEPVDQLPHLI